MVKSSGFLGVLFTKFKGASTKVVLLKAKNVFLTLSLTTEDSSAHTGTQKSIQDIGSYDLRT